MFSAMPHWLRASFSSIIAIFIWAIWSLPSLIENRPVDFQASGSIIVAWAIFSYGRDRAKREKAISNAQTNAMVSAHNYLHAELEFSKSLSHNTSNMHSLSHLKILQALGMQDSNVKDTEEAIKSLELEAADQFEHNSLFAKLQVASKKAEDDLKMATNMNIEQGKWVGHITRVELVFAIIGTLQWGYGDRWVTAIFATGLLG